MKLTKKIIVAIAATLVCSVAFAGAYGVLVAQQTGYSVGGQLGWVCTYSVNGNDVTIWEQNYCPESIYFN
jgi:hypothetical protein